MRVCEQLCGGVHDHACILSVAATGACNGLSQTASSQSWCGGACADPPASVPAPTRAVTPIPRDIAPEGDSLEESNRNLDQV
jgi:hypothetical protein